MIVRFTHTIEMEWMLPGVAPTGRRVECPIVAIVTFRDLLAASSLPVAGVETARKLADPTLPSNELIERARASRPHYPQ